MNGVPYKINEELFYFMLENNHKYNFFIPENEVHPLSLKTKLSKAEISELESFKSKQYLDNNVMNIAYIYSRVPYFYLPVRMDNRGRVYCQTEYLNYQSNELAKSLILFYRADEVDKFDKTAIEYLKVFGANCYGNKVDKLSLDKRIEWIDSHHDDIINYNNGELLSKANNKCLFLAFCLEYNKYINSLNNEDTYFITHLPIQLDATCNGYQHLALLCRERSLMSLVNIGKSNRSDVPKDFYGVIVLNLICHIKSQLERKDLSKEVLDSYKRLYKLDMDRAVIKKAVMTIVYNVSPNQMVEYLAESIKAISDIDIREGKALSKADVRLLARDLLETLHKTCPKLQALMNYLRKVAGICSKLNIEIP